MNKELIFPWTADPDKPESVWAKGFLSTCEFGARISTMSGLSSQQRRQITAISSSIIKFKVWATCLSASPYYMRVLYPYIAAIWVYSQRDTAYILDVDTLLDGAFTFNSEEKESFKTKILSTGLLIIPYIDPNHMGIKKARSAIAALLMTRKLNNKPVLTDLQIQKKPTDMSSIEKYMIGLKDVLGESSLALFKDYRSKLFIVTSKEKISHG